MFAYSLVVALFCGMHSLVVQPADLSFGRAQVKQLLCDRPDLGSIIKREPALRALLESGFAGEVSGERIYWDNREPINGVPSVHLPPYDEYPALVRVSKQSRNSAIDKCTMLVIEVQHGRYDKNYQALMSMAAQKEISRNDFARKCIRFEFEGAARAKEFFDKHPLAEANSKSDPYYTALMRFDGDFSAYMRRMDDLDEKEYNPRRYFLQLYDELAATKSEKAAILGVPIR
jgi:hypothetical protein